MELRMVFRSGGPTGPCSQTSATGLFAGARLPDPDDRVGRSGREAVDGDGIVAGRVEQVGVPGAVAELQLEPGCRAVGVVPVEAVAPTQLESAHQPPTRSQVPGAP